MKNSESKIPEIIFNYVANLTGYWRIFGLNVLIMKSDMRLTTLLISLNPASRAIHSEQEGPLQNINIFNSTIDILKTTAGISISITSCFTIGSDTTYIELENGTLNISNSVFHNVANNRSKYSALVFAWGNSKVTAQDTIIKPWGVLAVIINHSELHMKNVSFKGTWPRWPLVYDKTVLVSYNSSVINMETCSFTDFVFYPYEFGRMNWTFVTLSGNSFSNKCDMKETNCCSVLYTYTACTLDGATGVVSYFEDTRVAMYNSTFYGKTNMDISVWVAKHSKLFAHNLIFSAINKMGILGTDSQIEAVKYHDIYGPLVIIAAQDSNVSIKDYNTSGDSGSISFVNSHASVVKSIFTGKGTAGYGAALCANDSVIWIQNSTFSGNVATNGVVSKPRYFDMYLTNSTLNGILLQLGGIIIENYSFINITNSVVKGVKVFSDVFHDSTDFNVFVTNHSTAHFTSTMFLSGKERYFDDLLEYDREFFVSDSFPSVFFTCNSSSMILTDCNFINTIAFRIYLSSSIMFLNTNFENNAGIYEVADNSYLQFDGCSLLRGTEKMFVNKGSVLSIKHSNIAYGRSKFTLLNKSLLRLLQTNIFDNIFRNVIVAQLQSSVIISNCIYSNNSRIEGSNTTEVHTSFISNMIKSIAAAINDSTAFINISSSTISVQDSTLSGNIGTLIATSVSNVTFNNCTIENNVAISKVINFMEFISSNVNIERSSFFNNSNSLFDPETWYWKISESQALILMKSELKETGNFVSLQYSRFNNSGLIILKDILDTCIESCNFSNNYFQMESSSTVDVLKKMFVLRISASNFFDASLMDNHEEYPYIIFQKGTSSGLNLFSSARLKEVLFKMFTYQQKGLTFPLWPRSGSVFTDHNAILHHEEHAYASGKFPF